jgi:hypothetical protein
MPLSPDKNERSFSNVTIKDTDGLFSFYFPDVVSAAVLREFVRKLESFSGKTINGMGNLQFEIHEGALPESIPFDKKLKPNSKKWKQLNSQGQLVGAWTLEQIVKREKIPHDTAPLLQNFGFTIVARSPEESYHIELPEGWSFDEERRIFSDQNQVKQLFVPERPFFLHFRLPEEPLPDSIKINPELNIGSSKLLDLIYQGQISPAWIAPRYVESYFPPNDQLSSYPILQEKGFEVAEVGLDGRYFRVIAPPNWGFKVREESFVHYPGNISDLGAQLLEFHYSPSANFSRANYLELPINFPFGSPYAEGQPK